jgi:nitrite reductase/ring-hydroxylating ferredoxin subunit
MGAWISTAVLDVTPGGERSARLLIGVGLAGAAPAALAGWLDWAEQHEQQMRVGLVHVAANVTAIGCYSASLVARMRGRTGWGRSLAFAGLAGVGAAGWLGGHIAYRQAAGANHAEDVPHLVEPGWHAIGSLADLPDGEPVRLLVGEVPVLVVRDGEGVRALADRCAHLSGPLSEGAFDGECVTCPWHGSVFRLSDGAPVHGPATARQPVFETRVRDGVLEISLSGAG